SKLIYSNILHLRPTLVESIFRILLIPFLSRNMKTQRTAPLIPTAKQLKPVLTGHGPTHYLTPIFLMTSITSPFWWVSKDIKIKEEKLVALPSRIFHSIQIMLRWIQDRARKPI